MESVICALNCSSRSLSALAAGASNLLLSALAAGTEDFGGNKGAMDKGKVDTCSPGPRAGAVAARAKEVTGVVAKVSGVFARRGGADVGVAKAAVTVVGFGVLEVVGMGVGCGELCCNRAASTTRGRRGRSGVFDGVGEGASARLSIFVSVLLRLPGAVTAAEGVGLGRTFCGVTCLFERRWRLGCAVSLTCCLHAESTAVWRMRSGPGMRSVGQANVPPGCRVR